MTTLRFLILLIFGILISIHDIRTRKIPNASLGIFAIASLAIYLRAPGQILSALLSVAIVAILLLPILFFRRDSESGIGGGDIKLIIVLALLLGKGGALIAALIVALFVAGFQIGLLSLIRRRFTRTLAFAPALFLGALLAIN
jgi:leader peptidase (prepilin peptidase)/N-methyltransferase